MAQNTRKSPRKSPQKAPELNQRDYNKWTNEQKTWVAEYLLEHKEEYGDVGANQMKMCQAMLEILPVDVFPNRAKLTVENMTYQCKQMRKTYIKFSKRLEGSGEGLTAAEQRKYDNLERTKSPALLC
jgi:hypothetical protein